MLKKIYYGSTSIIEKPIFGYGKPMIPEDIFICGICGKEMH